MKEPLLGARALALGLAFLWSLGAIGTARADDEIDIPYEKFVLDNGLTLLVHVDRKAPIAAVNVWYHVGSKDEKPGRTGFAHLFEHLMFNGSEHFDDDYFKALDRVGATDTNGTTSADRTNYFQNVPNTALDVVLWLESDRMGHLLGAVTQERLDEQRGVVKNEKRQSENQPYGRVWSTLSEMAFPAGHPYSWPTIGSMEDLDAASLDDVHGWFKEYYGPSNPSGCASRSSATSATSLRARRCRGPCVGPRCATARGAGSSKIACPRRVSSRRGTCRSSARSTATA